MAAPLYAPSLAPSPTPAAPRVRRHLVAVPDPDGMPRPERARPRARVSAATFWRRRVAVALVAVGLVAGAARTAGAIGSSPLAAPDAPPSAPVATVVRPGDSWWTIAERLAPGEDPRPIVHALRQGRDGEPLLVGERISYGG